MPETSVGAIAFVAIGADDRWLHVYSDLRDLLGDTPERAVRANAAPGDLLGGGNSRRGTEFFDADGSRHVPVFDENWQLIGLEPVGDADPETLHKRICAVVAHVDAFLPENSADAAELRRLFAASPTLRDALAGCAPIFGHLPDDFHKAGLLHNLAHRIFG